MCGRPLGAQTATDQANPKSRPIVLLPIGHNVYRVHRMNQLVDLRAVAIEERKWARILAEYHEVRNELTCGPAVQHEARWLQHEGARALRAKVQRHLMRRARANHRRPTSHRRPDDAMDVAAQDGLDMGVAAHHVGEAVMALEPDPVHVDDRSEEHTS